ncbi:amino acid adenylation domain-containing protein [Nocardia puris]|uniref:Amino acid adenylation domain-containing protein n=1 Tax=Nocardia puris TaxID=208602 RepID=A0A366CYX7_9NOCA|nr:non-ribosomal peptide synthetase [Nocardia puris]RBO83050.1 amino acid adenylation domain-containing protein [Nocardia puris]
MTSTARTRPVRTRRQRVITLPHLMAAAVEAGPQSVAVVHADATATLGSLTYAELDERSNRLARLLFARGVGPGDLVAVAVPRGLDSVVAVWAVAKTGAGFVPVDPNYPADRVEHMVTDSDAVLGLTVGAVRAGLSERVEWLVVDGDELSEALAQASAEPVTHVDRPRAIRAEDAAYVIYTSGSTGLPKGVVVTQAGLGSFCEEQRQRYRVSADSRTLHFASPSFDASVLELLLALGGPATMVVADPSVYGGDDLAALLRRERVTHGFITPAALASVDPAGLDDLRVVVAGGEACPPELVRRWVLPIAEGTREFYNGYGPTETTIMTNISDPLVPGEVVTIGAPIRGITEYVLDERLTPVPGGVVGELYITGAQLARGYHRRRALTASRFVANPFEPSGSRLYRTGDLVRWTASGALEYMGRNDFQVKIRGFRIELGEIDAVLAAHDSVDFAVTVGHKIDSGATILASYVHAAPGATADPAELIAWAERSLPAHMVPTALTVLDAIPLTPVGKLDRDALPAPVLEQKEYRAPRTPVEQVLAEVMAEVLGVERLGVDDDFFALGGDSITSIQVVSRARARGVVFTPRELFATRTIDQLAALARTEDPETLADDFASRELVRLDDAERARLAAAYPGLSDIWPLTPLQSGMLFHAQLAESSIDAYITQFVIDLGGEVDHDRLRAAAAGVLGRHANLRVAFTEDAAGDPIQIVLDDVEVPWQYLDLSGDTDPDAAFTRLLDADMLRRFPMDSAPLLRFTLARTGPGTHRLIVTSHHILIDGWSMPLLTRDLLTWYALGDGSVLPPARPYRDYLAWLDAQDQEASRAAWRAALDGVTEPTPLAPVDPAREIAAGIGVVDLALSEADTAALSSLAAATGVTVNTIVQAAWGLLIGRATDRDDVVFGATVSGRPPQLAGVETMVGLFLNAIPVRVRLRPGATLAELLHAVQAEQAELLDHHYLGLSEIQGLVGVEGLFDSLVVFESFPIDREALNTAGEIAGGLTVTGALAVNGSHYPLTVMVIPDAALQLSFKYLRDVFTEDDVRALAGRFTALLHRFVTEADARVADVDVLTAAERAELTARNATDVPELVDDATLIRLFDAQADRTPDAPAVLAEGVTLTYAELRERSAALAGALAAREVGPEALVAVAMRRSVELVVAVYAVLRTGAGYVPIDPDHPAERSEFVLAGAEPVCVLTRAADEFTTSADIPVVAVDDLTGAPLAAAPVVRPDNVAYVIYTSGSTGRPKGVAITHRQMVNQFRWAQSAYPHDGSDVVLHKTPITFDISTWELFWPLQVGAAIVVAEPDGHRDPAYLARTIDEFGVTSVHFVPSMLDAFLDGAEADGRHESLRWVFAAGEALSTETATRFAKALPGTRLENWYGPAEATVVTAHPAADAEGVSVPIGVPVANTRVYVLDRQLREVPPGSPGELYVAGVQLARGYYRAAGLTAERFVAHRDGQRLYRTGDVVRWRADGTPALEYLGRSDFQVKLRGQRIELGEIEAVLLGHDTVHRAAVALVHGAAGDRLVAYVVAEGDARIEETAVLDHVRAHVPSYMVPSAVVVLDRMPLNASGKFDRKALPKPEIAGRAHREPATDAERTVAAVFAEVLGADRVGADDDFFDLGGNSLAATRVAARLGQAIGARVPVRAVFEAPTVAGLAAALGRGAGGPARQALTAGPRPDPVPLSLAQQRMWFLNRFDTASAVNNLPVAVRLTGELDVAALRQAVGDVVARHETLRTVYPVGANGVAHQVILTPDQATPDLRPQPVTAGELGERIAAAVSAGFDVTTETSFRAELFEVVGTDEHVLVVVAHHISADGWSMGPLTRDVMLAYAARHAGQAPGWAPLPVQYADFSVWQRAVLGSEDDPASLISAQAAYWREALAGLPDELNLPADRPRPAAQSFAGGTVAFTVDAARTERLDALAKDHNATLFMVLHAALAVLLARLSGTEDVAVGTPVAGRGEAELDDVIGMFVNTLVLRTAVPGDTGFDTLLDVVREADLGAFAHADLPFERLVEILNPARSTARHPLFQVMLSVQNLPENTLELPGLRVEAVDFDIDTAKFDLMVGIKQSAAGLYAEISYAKDLFDADTVRGFADRFVRLLGTIVDNPATPVGDLDLLAEDERARLTAPPARREIGSAATLVELFEAQARKTPFDPAVIDRAAVGQTEWTYAEFATRVHRLARRLVDAGVGPETLVALGIRRSVDLVVAMYAVLEAGGGYVPLDLDQPADRIRYVLETASPVCVLTTERDGFDTAAVGFDGELPVLTVDTEDLSGYRATPLTDADRRAPLTGAHPAYVIFTSGSTGRPKGVAVPHSAVVNQIRWITAEYGIGDSDTVLFKTPATFDVSVWELFGSLTTGARLVVATADGHRDPHYLADTIAAEGVTITSFVPSMLTVFAGTARREALDSLRALLVAGEAFTSAEVAAIRRVTDAELHNLYGPTEFTVHATYAAVDEQVTGAVPIGVPVWNAAAYVLDARLHPVPAGVAGELYLSGDQVARGYLSRPDLSSERFVADPSGAPGARMYRTGDLVRWNRDGALVYLGRTDFQVKLRGLRIELPEIEAALLGDDAVAQSVVVVREDPHTGDRLVGYVVPEAGQTVDTVALRERAAAALPAYMVPSALVVLDEMPLNPNGKLDRKALPEPVFEQAVFRAPNTPVEQIVAGVFAEVLGDGDRQLGLDDDFFALGGNSLLATQVAARIGAALDTAVPVRLLFEASTVAALAAAVEQADGERIALVAGPRPERVPLSLAQRRMWFLNRFDAESAAYNIPIAVRLSGDLDIDALRLAVADLIERHEILRTVYPQTDAGPVQVILPADGDVPTLAVRALDAAELESAMAHLITTQFDVTAEVPLRAALFDLGGAEYVLAMVVHHISGDGFSIGPLTRDLMIAYAARTSGAAPGWSPLPVQYADFSIWQRALLGDEDDPNSRAAAQIAYWRDELAGLPDQLELPTDRPRPATQSFAGAKIPVEIDAETHRALAELARAEGATLFMVVHTALAVLLARLSGGDDIAIGTPIAGRGEAALDDLIGMFMNTLVLRARVAPGAPFTEILAAQRAADVRAFAHADVPFERLVEVLNPARSTARHPLFQVGLSFQNMAAADLELPGLRVAGVDIETHLSQFDLHLIVGDRYDETGAPAGIGGTLTYATDLFDAETARAVVDRFHRVLAAVVAEPSVRAGEIEILDDAERTRILRSWNATEHPVDPETTLVDLLEATVAARPEAIALSGDRPGHDLTFAELDARVNRLARYLLSLGVGPDERVALVLPRSVDLVVAMYAVAKAGGAYLPLDPDMPVDRTTYILDTAAPICVLTSAAVGFTTDAAPVFRLDDLDLAAVDPAPIRAGERRAPLRAAHTAYVLFTSGSTGRPKGVAVPHGAIVNQMLWMVDEFGIDADDVTLLNIPATFDVSVWAYWSPGVCGSRLVIAAPDGHRDPVYLTDLMRASGVTTLHVVPSMLDGLLTAAGGETSPALRRVLAIGEALPAAVAQRFDVANPAVALLNLYGPTEAAVSVTWHRIGPGDTLTVPIGVPEWNTGVYVLDQRLRPVPAGVSGELYLSGVQLARCYFARPDLTSDRFVANPFEPGARMYRTGDLVAWRADGTLIYRGRTDFQVKVRGFRIELGEIEAALLRRDSVAEAAVLAHSDPHLGDLLVAYVSSVDGAALDTEAVRTAIAAELPSYMVPSVFVTLDRLPRNPNGKLDRKALPAPELEGAAFRAPATPVEEIVAGVFADVLGVERIGADDDFFALGGNSLLATQVVARLGAALATRVPVRELFEASTVAALAVRVERHAGAGGRPALTAGPRPERVPLSLAQQRMWFLNRFDPGAAVYNIPAAVRLTGDLDVPALVAAVGDLLARHEVLRTVYPATPEGPVQRVLPLDQAVPAVTVEPVAAADLPDRVRAVVTAGFDVTAEVPLRVALLRVTGTEKPEHVVVFVAHHISADGWSMGPLTRDVMAAYAARTAGLAPNWAPLPVQYADFSLWQRAVLGSEDDPGSLISAQAAYWRAALAGLPDELSLPADRPRPAVPSYAGGRVAFEVDAEVHRALTELARTENATLFMVLHAALAVLLARLSGTEDVAVGTPVAGRGEAELDDVIGMFVNTLVLRTQVPGALSFTELLAEAKETDLRAFAHADLPFERLVELLNPARSTARHPLFQVMLSLANLPETEFELPGLRLGAVELESDTAKFDLSLTVSEAGGAQPGGLYAEFSYAKDLFDADTAQGFADRFVRLLRLVADNPAAPVGDLDLLAEGERTALLTPPARREIGGAATLVDLFQAQVRETPLDPAVIDRAAVGQTEWTYTEFASRVHRLARRLVDAGVGPETLVALGIRRSVDLVVAMYAVLEAGGGYVPLDLDQPADRIHYVLDTAAPVCVLTTERDGFDTAAVGFDDDAPVLAVDTEDLSGYGDEPLTDGDRRAPLRAAHPAYVIFTSGSTGRPKGVAVPHSAVVNQIGWITDEYGIEASDTVLFKTPATFDVSVWELFGSLTTGARLVVATADGHRDPHYLADTIAAEGVTITSFVPSMLTVFAGTARPEALSSLRTLLIAGEAFTAAEVAAIRRVTDAELHNLYGPTEFTVHATYAAVDDHVTGAVPIGAPVWNAAAYVLDARLHPVPAGVAGELYLAGDQVARGYLSRPDLTSERFVADPYGKPGTRMYRTGDLVRWNRDGALVYLGRTDFQVKLRGLRIELPEIEAALLGDDTVAQSVVVMREDPHTGERLVGYVVPKAGQTVDTAALRERAAAVLPAYMVPSALVVLDEMPLNPNGKLDRKALPEPVFEQAVFRPPNTPLASVVATAFEEVLGTRQLGLDDDFFALGGNSLLATRVVELLRTRTGAELTVAAFFVDPTVEGLVGQVAAALEAGHDYDGATDSALAVLLPIRAAGERAPLFCLPPMAGMSWSYAGLARFLPADQPIYGLQSPALSEDDFDPADVSDLVDRYVAEIVAVRPHGPYRLLGWSLGGLLAHGVAAALQARGERVELLAILDGVPAPDLDDFRAEVRQAFAGLGIDLPADADLATLDDDALAAVHAALVTEPALFTLDRLGRIYRGALRTVELAAAHRPGVFEGRVDYFTATIPEADGRTHGGPADWAPHVRGPIENHPIATTHLAMTSPESLAELGPRLAALLEQG